MSKYNKEELEKLLLEDNMTYEAVGRIYEVTGNAIKKAATRLGIDLPKRRKINPSETFNKGIRDPSKIKYCVNCGAELDYSAKKYCNNICQGEYEYKQKIQEWKEGSFDGIIGKDGVSNHLRRYLFEKFENKCCKCNWGIINKFTNLIPLQVHHIDGNCLNNLEENLELLCPNCHSLTDNYGNANKNSSRTRR